MNLVFFRRQKPSKIRSLLFAATDHQKIITKKKANFQWPQLKIAYFRRPLKAAKYTLISAVFYFW
jgi:hypothetical protein